MTHFICHPSFFCTILDIFNDDLTLLMHESRWYKIVLTATQTSCYDRESWPFVFDDTLTALHHWEREMNMKTYFLLVTFLLRFFFSHYPFSVFSCYHFPLLYTMLCGLTHLLELASKRCISSSPFHSLFLLCLPLIRFDITRTNKREMLFSLSKPIVLYRLTCRQ